MKKIVARAHKNGATVSFLHERFAPFNFETDVICDSPELLDELKKAYEVWESRGRPVLSSYGPYFEIGSFFGVVLQASPDKPTGWTFG